jgi:hypothetical protein
MKNAIIRSTNLGYEGHGIMTANLHLDYGGGGQAFGGYDMGGNFGMEFIKNVIDTVGVQNWEELPGKHIRVEAEHTLVSKIGNIIEDKWFDPKELANKIEVEVEDV